MSFLDFFVDKLPKKSVFGSIVGVHSTIKNVEIIKSIKGIISFLLGLFILYLIVSFGWNALNIQSCSYDLPENPTCEQIAENNTNNCKYLILRWKKVNYDDELEACKKWEQKQEKD